MLRIGFICSHMRWIINIILGRYIYTYFGHDFILKSYVDQFKSSFVCSCQYYIIQSVFKVNDVKDR